MLRHLRNGYISILRSQLEGKLRKLWPGPVGLVFDVPEERRRQVAAELRVAESDLYDGGTITLRCPDHIVATDVLSAVEGPVAMTQAGAAGAGAGAGAEERMPAR